MHVYWDVPILNIVSSRGGVEDTRLKAKAKDRASRGQDQGPRTQTQVFSKKKKVFKIFFQANLYLRKPKKRSLQIFRKVSGVFQRNFNCSKIVLSLCRGQGNFRGLEASRPRPRTSKYVLEDSTSGKQYSVH